MNNEDCRHWPDIEKEYNSKLDNKEKGAGNKPARMIVGAMIVKHKLGLSDQETIDIIRENPYMQYLCGPSEFTDKPIFDSSLFIVLLRQKRDEAPEGTLLCTHRSLASNNEYGHRWGLSLHPCRCGSELIQRTIICNDNDN